MAKLSIAVNPRDLRDLLQSSLGLVPLAKVPGLLRTLEKIAGRTSVPGPFEVGITALRCVGGEWEIEPRNEDLLKEGFVTSMLHGSDKKVLIALHSSLFAQLFRANGDPSKEDVNRSASVKKKQGGPGEKSVSSGQKNQNGAGAAMASRAPHPVAAAPDCLFVQPRALDGGAVEQNGSDNAVGGHEKRIVISEKQLFVAIKTALDCLEFADLLALSRAVLDALDALKSGASVPALRCSKRLVGLGDALNFELESEENTAALLVRGLLAGLGFSSLMQLNGEFAIRMNVAHAGSRKAAVNS